MRLSIILQADCIHSFTVIRLHGVSHEPQNAFSSLTQNAPSTIFHLALLQDKAASSLSRTSAVGGLLKHKRPLPGLNAASERGCTRTFVSLARTGEKYAIDSADINRSARCLGDGAVSRL
jgi:hypothetical protein